MALLDWCAEAGFWIEAGQRKERVNDIVRGAERFRCLQCLGRSSCVWFERETVLPFRPGTALRLGFDRGYLRERMERMGVSTRLLAAVVLTDKKTFAVS